MCIVASVTPAVATASVAAQELSPAARQQLALDALAGHTITELAGQHQVSRKFVYQQLHRAEQGVEQAFAPAGPAGEPILFWLPVTKSWLRQLILALVLIGRCSLRGVQELVTDLFDYPLALGTVHNLIQQAVTQAREANKAHDLACVRVGAVDEIFQAGQPVLVGVDVDSTFCYLLSLEEQRDADTWGVRLLELADRHLEPDCFVADFGTSLRAGLTTAFAQCPCRGDIFHALRDGPEVVTTLEKRAYQALETCQRLERQQATYMHRQGRANLSLTKQLVHAKDRANQAVALLDDITVLLRWLREDILAINALATADRRALYDFVVQQLHDRAAQGPQRLGQLAKLLGNHQDDLLAFAVEVEHEVARLAQEFELPKATVGALLEVEVQDERDPRRWPRYAALQQTVGSRFYGLQQAVAAVVQQTVRASSVIENLNSRLRNYFTLRRHLGNDYLTLLQFFLNHRRFQRSEHPERVGRSPAELLTGQSHPHWLELLGYQRFTRN
jgi:hypothetical protein